MLLLHEYGELPKDYNLTVNNIYTLQVGFIGKQPSVGTIKEIISKNLSAFIEIKDISSPALQYRYNLIFKFKKQSYSLNKLISLLEMHFTDHRLKAYDFWSEKKEIPKQETKIYESFKPAIDVVTTPVKGAYNIVESGASKIASYLPSLTTLKWIGIAAGAGVVLFYIGPLLRAAGTGAQRIVERIPERKR